MNGAALIIATLAVVLLSASRHIVAGLVAADGASGVEVATQGGIAVAALTVGYYMLKRADSREKDQNVRAEAENKALRDEMAIMRGENLQKQDQLIAALTEVNRLLIENTALKEPRKPA